MLQLISYELKKILRRPFTLVVAIGCALVFLILNFSQMNSYYTLAWRPTLEEKWAKYDTGENYFGEGVAILEGKRAIEFDKERTAHLNGTWDEARTREIIGQYYALRDNPANYTDELDIYAMEFRRHTLSNYSLSDVYIDGLDEAAPIYEMQPEFQYGEWQAWYNVGDLIESYLTDEDGDPLSLADAFPQIQGEAVYTFHQATTRMADFQAIVGGFLGILLVLAGLAPLFSDEVTRGTEPMLLAARHGRGRLVAAKLIAGSLFAAVGVIFLALVNLLSTWAFFGLDGLGMTLQLDYFHASVPFATTIGGYFVMNVLFQLVGAISLAGLVAALSALFSSAFPVLFAGALWSIGVPMLAVYGPPPVNTIFALLPTVPLLPVITLGSDILLAGIPFWLATAFTCAVFTALCWLFVLRRYKTKR